MTSSNALAPSDRSFAVVDLIGDLDATLGNILAETLGRLIASGTTDVLVTARHVATSSNDGLARLDAACSAARASGATVAIEPGNRRMRAAFSSVSLATERRNPAPRPRSSRHLIIARHAETMRLLRTA